MSEGVPWKSLVRFAVPILIGSLLQQLYHTMDTMMVGKLIGEQALSGVGTCGLLTNLLLSFSIGFSAGSSVVSAQYFGAGRIDRISRNAYTSLIFLGVLSIGISLFGIIFGKVLLRTIVAVPDSLLDIAVVYFRIYSFGFVFQFLYNGIAALLRSIGDSRASVYFLAISSFSNILLNYMFTHGFI